MSLHPRIALLALACVLAVAAAATAGSGPKFALPNVGVKNKAGLRLAVDGRGVDANGYRPIRIEVTPWPPAAPFPADRQIRLVINQPSLNFQWDTPAVSQIIELPEGATRVNATVSVPQTSVWYGMSLDVFEGGDRLEELCVPYMGWPNTSWEVTESRPATLFVHSGVPPRTQRDTAIANYNSTVTDAAPTFNLPDVRTFRALFPDAGSGRGMLMPGSPAGPAIDASARISDTVLLAHLESIARLEMLPPEELPARWIDLSQYDVIVIPLADLRQFRQRNAPAADALRAWLATGPVLLVYGVGADDSSLGELERLLELPPAGDSAPGGWRLADPNADRTQLTPDDPLLPGRPTWLAQPATSEGVRPAGDEPATRPPWHVRSRPAGLGRLVAVAHNDPLPGKVEDWSWLFNNVPDNHWKWFRRHGFSLHRENNDYWSFLIPGVGRAPVWSFLLLVSLFAVLIGPVNYLFLGRLGRLYLLLITVPLGAAVVTLALFSYALVTDGLSVRMRSRSFTHLDQRTGQTVVWARQSYYAAIAPSQGLAFPTDTVVFPIRPEADYRRGRPGAMSGRIEWGDEQLLAAGYLPSRTTVQYVLTRATTTDARLVVRDSTAGGELAVENRLQAPLHYLLVRDRRGDYFAADSLAEGAPATLRPVAPRAAQQKIQEWLAQARPANPLNYDPAQQNNALSFLWPRYRGWALADAAAGAASMSASLLESNLAQAALLASHPPPPGSYLAIADRPRFVPRGVRRAQEDASIHVIRGSY